MGRERHIRGVSSPPRQGVSDACGDCSQSIDPAKMRESTNSARSLESRPTGVVAGLGVRLLDTKTERPMFGPRLILRAHQGFIARLHHPVAVHLGSEIARRLHSAVSTSMPLPSETCRSQHRAHDAPKRLQANGPRSADRSHVVTQTGAKQEIGEGHAGAIRRSGDQGGPRTVQSRARAP